MAGKRSALKKKPSGGSKSDLSRSDTSVSDRSRSDRSKGRKKKRGKGSKSDLRKRRKTGSKNDLRKKGSRGSSTSLRRSGSRSSATSLRASGSKGSRTKLRGSGSKGSRTSLRGSRSRGSRSSLRGSRSRGSRTGLRGSRSRGSRTSLRGSKSRGSRTSLRGSKSRGSRHSLRGSASRGSAHALRGSASRGSRHNLGGSLSKSSMHRLGMSTSRSGIGGRAPSSVNVVKKESRWSLTPRGKCAQLGLFLFNSVFLITGTTIMGLGIWLRLDQRARFFQTAIHSDKMNEKYIDLASNTMIGFGVVIVMVTVFGCCGACSENRWLLTIYVVLLIVVYIGEIGMGIVAALFKGKAVRTLKSKAVRNFHEGNYIEGGKFAIAWDFVQQTLKCCGVYNFTDYNGTYFEAVDQSVPSSCCKRDPKDPKKPLDIPGCHHEVNKSNNVYDPEEAYLFLMPQGCFDSLKFYINKHLAIILGVICSIVFVELMGIIFSCCICYSQVRKGATEIVTINY